MCAVYTGDKENIYVPEPGKFGQSEDIEIWFDSTNGFDSNDGSQDYPIKTVEKLREMIPRYIDLSVTVLFLDLEAYRWTPFTFGVDTAIGAGQAAFHGPGYLRFMGAPGLVQTTRPSQFTFFNIKCELMIDNFDCEAIQISNCAKVTIGSVKLQSVNINGYSTYCELSGLNFDTGNTYNGITVDGNCFVRIYPTITGSCSNALFKVVGGAKVLARQANISATFGSYKIEETGGVVVAW